jgi:hypothetical protein
MYCNIDVGLQCLVSQLVLRNPGSYSFIYDVPAYIYIKIMSRFVALLW